MMLQRSMARLLRIGDFFSLLNLSFGFISVIFILRGERWFALSFVMLSAISDGLDGIAARKLGEGELGETLDSLADLISFSISPSILIYTFFDSFFLLPLLLFYVTSSTLRLSSFPIFKKEDVFIGLPTTAAGMILASSCFFLKDQIQIGLIILWVSFIMISRIPYPKPDKVISSLALIIIILNLVFGTSFDMIFVKLLFLSSLSYTLFGPIYVKLSQ